MTHDCRFIDDDVSQYGVPANQVFTGYRAIGPNMVHLTLALSGKVVLITVRFGYLSSIHLSKQPAQAMATTTDWHQDCFQLHGLKSPHQMRSIFRHFF